MRALVLVLVACGSPAPPPPPAVTSAAPGFDAPTCTATGSLIRAGIEEGGVVACYLVPAEGDDVDCWRFEPSTKVWSFARRVTRARLETKPAVTATATAARVCKPDGTDCRTIPLSGITVAPPPDDALDGATNADRSLVAVWGRTGGPIHVFDAAGTRRATIKPWPTDMSDPSVFRGAHVLGTVLEVRIADTPISSAIRLYDARTGAKIADVYGGKPMDDTGEPGELGGTRYGFLTIDTRELLVVDVATGKHLASYPIGGAELSYAFIGRAGATIAGVVGTTGFVVHGSAAATVEAPTCPR